MFNCVECETEVCALGCRCVDHKPDSCPVCFLEMEEESPLCCGHWVHPECVILSQTSICPLCRSDVITSLTPSRYESAESRRVEMGITIDEDESSESPTGVLAFGMFRRNPVGQEDSPRSNIPEDTRDTFEFPNVSGRIMIFEEPVEREFNADILSRITSGDTISARELFTNTTLDNDPTHDDDPTLDNDPTHDDDDPTHDDPTHGDDPTLDNDPTHGDDPTHDDDPLMNFSDEDKEYFLTLYMQYLHRRATELEREIQNTVHRINELVESIMFEDE